MIEKKRRVRETISPTLLSERKGIGLINQVIASWSSLGRVTAVKRIA
jgi:hypothetical protein